MASDAEVEAAAGAIKRCYADGAGWSPSSVLARAALAAAEQVRAEEQPSRIRITPGQAETIRKGGRV